MQPIEHKLVHYYQPTNHSCGQTATAMLLSSLGRSDSPEEVLASVPVLSVGTIAEWGTLSQSLAKWMLDEGFTVEMHTADFQIIDLEWAGLDRKALLARMKQALDTRILPSLGEELSKVFLQTYIDYIEAGGVFHIHSYMSSDLLNKLLLRGPVFIDVSPNVLFSYGRSRDVAIRKSERDDLRGSLDTHFVVLYGINEEGRYLLADPWFEPGRHEVESERLLCAMTAGQIKCENTIFQASRP
ncbi:MAG: hypothetical protein ACREP9_20925, partial [Candidatus Dormibacteraceae bacterium]